MKGIIKFLRDGIRKKDGAVIGEYNGYYASRDSSLKETFEYINKFNKSGDYNE